MSIRPRRHPKRARDLALQEIAVSRGLPVSGVERVGAIPIYRRSWHNVPNDSKLTGSLTGWRFLLVDASTGTGWAADVGYTRGRRPTLLRIYGPKKVSSVLAASRTAEKQLRDSRYHYHPRILRMYGRVSEVLWLHCKAKPPHDRFVTFDSRKPSRTCQIAHEIAGNQWVDSPS